MLRIGLTGGIAAGKSVVERRFAELGAVVIDHDALAREVVAPGTVGLERIVEAFGPGVLSPDGTLDRPALGTVVFADDAALRTLEGIIHPEVRRLAAELEAAAVARAHRAVVVHDIPLLVETGQQDRFGLVVVVDAPAEQRVRRLMDDRHLTEAEARARVSAQASDEAHRAAADVVLDGTHTDDDLRAQVDALWTRVVAEAAEEELVGE